MNRKQRRITIIVLIYAIIGVAALNALLYYVDPLGYSTYIYDWHSMIAVSRPADHGFTFIPGEHRFIGYTARINEDGFREVPDSNYSGCTVGFIGDSFTFGLGVNDEQAFVNLLAKDIPARTLNFGIPAYSAINISEMMEYIHADVYIWLIFSNDDDAKTGWSPPYPPYSSLYVYLKFMGWDGGWQNSAPKARLEWFTDNADKILANENLLAFAFPDEHLSDVIAQRYPGVKFIPSYKPHVISYADGHANAKGNELIADVMRPYVLSFVNQRCEGK